MTYLDTLRAELTAAAIPARRRARILAEVSEHLHENPRAELGAPRDLARQFADELGTRLARTVALRAFAALSLAGLVLAVMFLGDGARGQFSFAAANRASTPSWAVPVLLIVMFSAQVSLASGSLALLRALRLRDLRVISQAEATVLARRTGVALLAGAVTMTGVPVVALAFPHAGGSLWHTLAWILTAVALTALVSVLPGLVRSFRLRPLERGEAGDLSDDLAGLMPPSWTPLRVALLLCGVIVVVVALAGLRAGDPYDGLARGLSDAAACMAGFIVLGRYLGMRAPG